MRLSFLNSGGIIKNNSGKIVAITNFALPPYQINFFNYWLQNLLLPCLGYLVFLYGVRYFFIHSNFHYRLKFSDLVWPPRYGQHILAYFYCAFCVMAIIMFLSGYYNSWRKADILTRGKKVNVYFSNYLRNLSGNGIELTENNSLISHKQFYFNSEQDISFIDKELLYTCYRTYNNNRFYNDALIIIDEPAFEQFISQNNDI